VVQVYPGEAGYGARLGLGARERPSYQEN